MNTKKRIKLTTNLINAEIYANCPELVRGVRGPRSAKKYTELVEVPDYDGTHFETVQKDYPITADYVNSFADAANYKKDIASALAAPVKQNLGDISNIQSILQQDNSDILQELDNLKKKVLQVQEKQKKADDVAETTASVSTSGSEVAQ